MPIYRFRILDNGNRVTDGQYSHCKDDDAAREHADTLAAQVKDLSVEIWSDQQREVPRKRPEGLTPADDNRLSRALPAVDIAAPVGERAQRKRPSANAARRTSVVAEPLDREFVSPISDDLEAR
jgi:hypothetical protein